MAYTTYDTFGTGQALGYPLSHTLSHAPVYGVHPTEFAYDQPVYAGTAYTDVRPPFLHLLIP